MPQKFVVIIAGGKGERFWPQSRAQRPKHLLPIVGKKPLLTQTLDRVKPLVPAKNIFVITSAIQEKAVREVAEGKYHSRTSWSRHGGGGWPRGGDYWRARSAGRVRGSSR